MCFEEETETSCSICKLLISALIGFSARRYVMDRDCIALDTGRSRQPNGRGQSMMPNTTRRFPFRMVINLVFIAWFRRQCHWSDLEFQRVGKLVQAQELQVSLLS
jgi:hypothetical protein